MTNFRRLRAFCWLTVVFTAAAFPADQASDKGLSIARQVANAMGVGHKDRAISIRAVFLQGEDGPNATHIEAAIVFPDHLQALVRSSNGNVRVVVTPEDAFIVTPDGTLHEMGPAQKQESLEQIKRDPVFIAERIGEAGFTFRYGGTERVGNIDANIVDVNADGAAIRWFVDPQSGRLLRETYNTVGENGSTASATELSDWRNFAGLTLPAKHDNYQGGKLLSVVTLQTLEINPKLDSAIFRRPAPKP